MKRGHNNNNTDDNNKNKNNNKQQNTDGNAMSTQDNTCLIAPSSLIYRGCAISDGTAQTPPTAAPAQSHAPHPTQRGVKDLFECRCELIGRRRCVCTRPTATASAQGDSSH